MLLKIIILGELSSLPDYKKVKGCRQVYKIKRMLNGSIECCKVRLEAKGYTQEQGLNCHETFALVVKMTTIRALLVVAITRGWQLYQLDVNNAFLRETLDEEVYMSLPT